MKSVPNENYATNYSESGFWEKIGSNVQKLGSTILLPAIELYVVLRNGKLSLGEKALVLFSLGYFISPADTIPDITPFIGYSDDLSLLMITTYKIFKKMSEEEKDKIRYAAEHRMRKLFGQETEES